MVAIGLLVFFQFLLTWLSVRTKVVQQLIKAAPTLLMFKGNFLDDVLKDKRVTKGEVLAAIRVKGYSCIGEIGAIVLETNGNFSVIKDLDLSQATAMRDVRGFREQAARLGQPNNS